MNRTVERLREARALAVLRVRVEVDLVRFVTTMAEAGWSCVEITSDTPGVFDAVTAIRSRFGDDVVIGVGTVLDEDVGSRAIDAGAQMLLSPGLNVGITAMARRNDVLVIPGALTPSEVLRARDAGVRTVKIFPVSCFGPGYLEDLRGPIDDVDFLPMGGIDSENAQRYLEAGAFAVGIGAAAVDRVALASGDWDRVRDRAARCISAVRS